MSKGQLTTMVGNILKDFLKEEGYLLYHCEFVKEGKAWFLRVFIDKDDGNISTEDCEKVSRYLSKELDSEDPIKQNYYLEVSSPGMDRKLFEKWHYLREIGSDVEVKLYKAKNGKKKIEGILKEVDGNNIKILDYDGVEWILDLSEIAGSELKVVI